MTNELTEWLKNELYPVLWSNIPTAFPEMDFKQYKSEWHSPKKWDGTPPAKERPDKTIITNTAKYGIRVLEQGESKTISLLDLRMRLDSSSNVYESVKKLADSVGRRLPQGNLDNFREWHKKQTARDSFITEAHEALLSKEKPEGEEVYNYLIGRGWTDEEVRRSPLGYMSPQLRNKYNKKDLGELPGLEYALIIPYTSRGYNEGFESRNIHTNETNKKYRKMSDDGNTKQWNSDNINGLSALRYDTRKDIVMVEGALDALHAELKGVPNVVSTSGKYIFSMEALAKAKAKGVERITLLIDHEETEKGDKDKLSSIQTAIDKIREADLKPFIVELPGYPGEKVDCDSFLKDHTGKELQEIINSAIRAEMYEFEKLKEKHTKGRAIADLTPKEQDDYLSEFINMILREDSEGNEVLNTREQKTLTREFFLCSGISINDLEALKEEKRAGKLKVKSESATKDLLVKANRMVQGGDYQGAVTLLTENLDKVSKISKEDKYRWVLEPQNSKDFRNSLRDKPRGVKTEYLFRGKEEGEISNLVLPIGELTFIVALPSHCKTALLRNLTLQLLRNKEITGTILFYSYEIDKDTSFVNLLNTYIGEALDERNKDNISVIRDYLEGEIRMTEEKQRIYEKKSREFDKYIDEDRLRIYDREEYSDDLIGSIETFSKYNKISAVVIDYSQKLYKEDRGSMPRNEELKKIMEDLHKVAKKLQIPIILASQMKREVKSPMDWRNQDIADSADQEREANVILLLWNDSFPMDKEVEVFDRYKDRDTNKTNILIEIGKNRGGIRGLYGSFVFDGLTGVISNTIEPNDSGTQNKDTSQISKIDESIKPF